jgi:hypothetical protein
MAAADALPEYDVRTRHEIAVDASPEQALAAAKAVTTSEAPLLRFLFRLRGLRARGDRPIWDAMAGASFRPFDADTLVGLGRPWRPWERLHPRDGDFRAFAEPGWAKLAMEFRAEDGRLVTETRVQLTDDAARRSFRRYWLVVGPFSGLVRRSWLKAARRRAESQPSG